MRSYIALALASVAAAEAMTQVDFDFMKYITNFGKRYATKEEFNARLALFKQADQEIKEHNLLGRTWTMGHNEFSDWTEEEFSRMLGFSASAPLGEGKYQESFTPTAETEVDWVAKGAVSEVKNQGSCGSCWSFSTTGSVEGAHFIATGELLSLSEQQLVSCSHNGNLGCMGGMMDRAFKWIETNPLETEADYPYHGWTGELAGCKADASKGKVTVTGYTDVTVGSSEALKAAIAQQPVSVAVQANQKAFQRYKSGVITADCGTKLDHGVLAVGFGVDQTAGEYYKVKNSWGASWGEDGFVRIAVVDGDGMCGIQMQPSYPATN